MAVLVGKNVQDNLYYVSVGGNTEILSEDAATTLLGALRALLDTAAEDLADVPSKDKQH